MSLDLFASNIDDAVNYAARVSAPELPSTFEDNIADAWSRGRMVESSVAGSLRKSKALSDYMDEVTAKSGTSLQMGETVDGFPSIGEMAVKVREIKAANPNVDIADLSDEEIQRRADEIGVRQLADSAALDRRERTAGGSVGSFLGTAGAAVVDPVNLIAFPLAAPTSLGILGTALAWGAIGAGSQTAIEALNMSSMERIQPGYGGSGEPVQNILGAGLVAGALGGGLKGLSSAWTRARTGSWPRTVRDAGNVVDSEVQIAATNPLPGIDGEAAHRTALNKAIDDIANGRPVDVDGIVSPEMVPHIEAWHGSPHNFDRFDASKIGTGEGAQVYGRGLYFAENEKVAKGYRSKLTNTNEGIPDAAFDDPKYAQMVDLKFELDNLALKIAQTDETAKIVDLDAQYAKVRSDFEPLLKQAREEYGGALYKVKITANKDRMLDLDVPLNQQASEVQAAVKQAMGIDYQGNFDAAKSERLWNTFQNSDGKTAVRQGFIASDDEVVSRRLADAGIPGLKYLDEGSRGQGDGTRNFVVFDDKNVQITHKNGKPVNAEIRQGVVDQAAGRPAAPPAQPELALAPPEPAKPTGPNADTLAALRDDLTPAKIEEMRTDVDMADTINRDLDKLMLERPDLEVPTGVIVDAEGRSVPTTRKIESVIAEADTRLAAAKEIEACVGPYPASEAA